jgi:hypothetical protein
LWIAGAGVTISALVLPVVTNVVSDLVPTALRPYLWISVPVALLLTALLIAIGRNPGAASDQGGTSIQHNTTYGGTSYAVQNGDLNVPPGVQRSIGDG